MAGAISVAANQRHIREFCPKDPTSKRFGTEESTEAWLQKNGGRGVFLLGKVMASGSGMRLAGYGWEGPEENSRVPEGKTTFAVRITDEGRGMHAGVDFTRVIVAAGSMLYGARDIWLETYGGNPGATGIYTEAGFVQTDTPGNAGTPLRVPCVRPTLATEGTLLPDGREVYMQAGQTVVDDERWYYGFPNELLPVRS